MNYRETIDYLFSQLPMFQRVGAPAYKADLSNTLALCDSLGNPQNKFRSIHIAGTNGKGSVSSALASVFASCGYKTGLFTSPHLTDFRERIRVNGEKIPEDYVIGFVKRFREKADPIRPSFFELTTAMAFEYFEQEAVDIAILETGMGGRLDSTNVVEPQFSIITTIGMDHQQFLGDTLEKIATEKGGIIKPGIPVIIAENDTEVEKVLIEIARTREAPVTLVRYQKTGYPTDLKGVYQSENMRTVASAVKLSRKLGYILPEEKVLEGTLNIAKNTGLRGRWEVLGQAPKIIADVAHNESGVARIIEGLRRESFVRLHMVWGMVSDKDAKSILRQLPTSATYYWCKPDVPRGRDAVDLAREALRYSLEGKDYPSVRAAFEAARNDAGLSDLIFVGGSVFVVAEVL